MLFIRKTCLVILMVGALYSLATAQDLEHLAPVVTSENIKDTTSFILTALDLSLFRGQFGEKVYANSIQIIDAANPWPPAWFASKPVYTREMFMKDTSEKIAHVDFAVKPEIGQGYISVGEIAGTVTLDGDVQNKIDALENFIILNKQLARVDTLGNRNFYGGGWSPGFRKKNNVELLSYTRTMITKDMRSYSNDPDDDSVTEISVVLKVIDVHRNVKFTWNPLEHLDPAVFRYKENLQNVKLFNLKRDQAFWCKFTSANWDYDGNILYALKDIGIGKVSVTDGSVLWQLRRPQTPLGLSGDEVVCVSPTDFKFLYANDTAVVYSFYEKGDEHFPVSRGVIFQLDKRTLKTKLIKYYPDRSDYIYCGQGAFDYNPANGNYLIGYGACQASASDDSFQDAFEYGKNDSTYAVFKVPKSNIVNGVHRLENWPHPPRPSIVDNGTVLEAKGDMTGWAWYKFEGPGNLVVNKVGTGKTIKPEKDGVYCVVGKYGIGYSVSKIYRYEQNAPY